jgi:hypothetical protein
MELGSYVKWEPSQLPLLDGFGFLKNSQILAIWSLLRPSITFKKRLPRPDGAILKLGAFLRL